MNQDTIQTHSSVSISASPIHSSFSGNNHSHVSPLQMFALTFCSHLEPVEKNPTTFIFLIKQLAMADHEISSLGVGGVYIVIKILLRG